jgi:hypothetical protein
MNYYLLFNNFTSSLQNKQNSLALCYKEITPYLIKADSLFSFSRNLTDYAKYTNTSDLLGIYS